MSAVKFFVQLIAQEMKQRDEKDEKKKKKKKDKKDKKDKKEKDNKDKKAKKNDKKDKKAEKKDNNDKKDKNAALWAFFPGSSNPEEPVFPPTRWNYEKQMMEWEDKSPHCPSSSSLSKANAPAL